MSNPIRRGELFAFLAVLVAGLLGCLWYRYPLLDDSYICFRYARNLMRGEGLVYNAGEYVEGYTTLLWVLLMSIAYPMRLNVEIYASVLGVVSLLGCVGVVWRYTRTRSGFSPVSFIAPVLVATNAYLVYWAGKGMETPLFILLVTGGALAASREFESDKANWLWGVWFGLAAVTRPEGILYGTFALAAVAGNAILRKKELKPLSIAGAWTLLPFGLQFLWRLWYYGDLLPNTFYAKMDANAAFYIRGFEYIKLWFGYNPLLAVSLLAGAACVMRLSPSIRFLVAFAWLGVGSVVIMGGDHFMGARLLVPFFPVLYVIAGELVGAFLRAFPRFAARHAPVWIGLAILLALRLTACLGHDSLIAYNRDSVADVEDRRRFGEWIRENSEPGDWMATAASGLLPYVADRPNIDCLGLTDRHIAHLDVELGEGYPGHEKGDGAYILERAPRFIVADHRLAPKAFFSIDFQYLFGGRRGLDFLNLPELDQWYRLRVEKVDGKFLHIYERRPEKLENPPVRKHPSDRRLLDERGKDWFG